MTISKRAARNLHGLRDHEVETDFWRGGIRSQFFIMSYAVKPIATEGTICQLIAEQQILLRQRDNRYIILRTTANIKHMGFSVTHVMNKQRFLPAG